MGKGDAWGSHRKTLRVVARRVRAHREALGCSQNELSRKLGLHHTAIAHIEAARRGPSLGILVGLAKHLGTTTDHLLGVAQPESVSDG